MKHLIAVILLGLVSPIFGGEEAVFETAKKPKIGESGAFKLSKSNRAILKVGESGYLVLDLLESSRKDGGKTFTEACSISWTLITPSSIKTETTSVFLRCRSKETKKNSFTVTTIGGSDTVELGGLTIRWSYASSERIFLYPSPGTKYATTEVEQNAAEQPATRLQSKPK